MRDGLNRRSVVDGSVKLAPEPLHGLVLGDSVLGADGALAAAAQAHPAARSLQDHVEVHAEDAGEGVVLEAQVDMLLDAEPEAAGIRKVALPKLAVLHLEAALEQFLGLLAADGDVAGDFFIALDAEATDGEAGAGGDGFLAGEIFEHLGS